MYVANLQTGEWPRGAKYHPVVSLTQHPAADSELAGENSPQHQPVRVDGEKGEVLGGGREGGVES